MFKNFETPLTIGKNPLGPTSKKNGENRCKGKSLLRILE